MELAAANEIATFMPKKDVPLLKKVPPELYGGDPWQNHQ